MIDIQRLGENSMGSIFAPDDCIKRTHENSMGFASNDDGIERRLIENSMCFVSIDGIQKDPLKIQCVFCFKY
jgi:hypothetical protein